VATAAAAVAKAEIEAEVEKLAPKAPPNVEEANEVARHNESVHGANDVAQHSESVHARAAAATVAVASAAAAAAQEERTGEPKGQHEERQEAAAAPALVERGSWPCLRKIAMISLVTSSTILGTKSPLQSARTSWVSSRLSGSAASSLERQEGERSIRSEWDQSRVQRRQQHRREHAIHEFGPTGVACAW
jgi:hypothetical protein